MHCSQYQKVAKQFELPHVTYGRQLVFLLVPVCVYFAVVTTSHFDIGARHLLPVYPFLYVLEGSGAAMMLRRGSGWATIAGGLLLWQVVTTVRVCPNYMAYGNEAWEGPLQVRRYLSDANVDWGQQLKTVKQYLNQQHNPDCWFACFPDGAVQPQDYGIQCHRLPTPSGLWWFNLPMAQQTCGVSGPLWYGEGTDGGGAVDQGPASEAEEKGRKPLDFAPKE